MRIRERSADFFGHLATRWRVIRTSNAYQFRDPNQGRQMSLSFVLLTRISVRNLNSRILYLLLKTYPAPLIPIRPWSRPFTLGKAMGTVS